MVQASGHSATFWAVVFQTPVVPSFLAVKAPPWLTAAFRHASHAQAATIASGRHLVGRRGCCARLHCRIQRNRVSISAIEPSHSHMVLSQASVSWKRSERHFGGLQGTGPFCQGGTALGI